MAIFHCYVSSPEGKVIVCRINDDLDGFSYVKMTNFHGESIPSIFLGETSMLHRKELRKPQRVSLTLALEAGAWPVLVMSISTFWDCDINPHRSPQQTVFVLMTHPKVFIMFHRLCCKQHTCSDCWWFCHHFSHMFHIFNHVPHIFWQTLLVNSRLSPSRALRALRALHRPAANDTERARSTAFQVPVLHSGICDHRSGRSEL